MTFDLQVEIDALIEREGGDKYTNDPNDSGGPTRWGITQFVESYVGQDVGLVEVR